MAESEMNTIELAKENCPYHSEEMRGAYYDGFVRAAALVRAERKPTTEKVWCDLTDDEIHESLHGKDAPIGLLNGIRNVIAAFKEKNK
jgi:hypothetical protein